MSAWRGRATRTITAWWNAYRLASTIVTSALLLFLVAMTIHKDAPVANPPQPPTGRHSPYPHPGSPFGVAEFQ